MGAWEDFTGWLTGRTQRDAQNEALDRQQAVTAQGFSQASVAQQTAFEAALKQLGLSNEQVQAILQQALQSSSAQGAQSIEQARQQAAQQAQGGQQTNQQMMGFLQKQLTQQSSENAPQLAAKNQMLQALQGRMLGLASGTGTFQPTALYNTQLGEMNKALNNQFASRGLGNSSAALTQLREGQNKLMATDQQQQFTNLSGMYNQLMNGNFSAVQPQGINLQNPYANLTDVSQRMQQAATDRTGIYNQMAQQAGLYGTSVANLQSLHGANLSNLSTGQGTAIGNIAGLYGSVPQGGIGTALNNALLAGKAYTGLGGR